MVLDDDVPKCVISLIGFGSGSFNNVYEGGRREKIQGQDEKENGAMVGEERLKTVTKRVGKEKM